MPRPVPTARDEQLLDFITTYTDQHSYAPTYREIAQELGIALKSVRDALDRLRSTGRVIWNDGQTRTLRVITETQR